MNVKQLSELQFFRDVNVDTLDFLCRHGSVVTMHKKEVIIRPKERSVNIYIQLSGKSIVYNMTHCGKRKILFIFGKGTLLNEHVQNTHEDAFFCETIETSQIFVIPVRNFIEAMEKDFTLTRAVLVAQEKKIWRLGHQLKNTMGSIYMERKLAAKLWKLSRDFGIKREKGIEIDINLPITFLADMLGAPRETTSKTCKMLVEYGLIEIHKKRIVVIDKEKMSIFYKTGKII